MSRTNVRKHPAKSIASSAPKVNTISPNDPAVVGAKLKEPVAACAVAIATTNGKRQSPVQTQIIKPHPILSPVGSAKSRESSIKVACESQYTISKLSARLASQVNDIVSMPSSTKSGSRGRSQKAASDDICRKYPAGRCRSRRCPKIHPSAETPSISSGPPQPDATSNAPSSASKSTHKNDECPLNVSASASARRPMTSSSVTNTPVKDAFNSQLAPSADSTNKLHIIPKSLTPSTIPSPPTVSTPTSAASANGSQNHALKENDDCSTHSKALTKRKPRGKRESQTVKPAKVESILAPAQPRNTSVEGDIPSSVTIDRPPTPQEQSEDSNAGSATSEKNRCAENPLPPRDVCRNFLHDRCRWGSLCHRYHPPRYEWHKFIQKSNKPCIAYEQGVCFLGENCYRYHPPRPSEGASLPDRSSDEQPLESDAQATLRPVLPHASASSNSQLVAMSTRQRESERADGSSSDTTAYYSFGSSSSDTSPRTMLKDIPPTVLFSTTISPSRFIEPCRDFSKGTCSRSMCKYAHVPTENHLNRIVNLLEQSTKRAQPQPMPQNLPAIQKANSAVRKTIPLLPPGLGLDKSTSEASQPIRPEVRTIPVDTAQVTFGPGFEVKAIQTGFESRKIFLKNVPTTVDEAAIRDALAPFGSVQEIQIPASSSRASTMVVRAAFSTTTEAVQAVSALDGAHVFGGNIAAQLVTHKSTAIGKGIVRDGDLLLEFPAPCIVGYLGFSTLERAEQAAARITGTEMSNVQLFAVRYEGLPMAGAFNVKVLGLPPNTRIEDLARFGHDQGGMLAPAPNYKSLEDAAEDLQELLEKFGELITINIQGAPYIRQTIRACAHFTTPDAAENACRSLHGRHLKLLGGGRMSAYHVRSVLYKLPPDVFAVIEQDIDALRTRACSERDRHDVVIFRRNCDNSSAPVTVKLVAGKLPSLTKLKKSFEEILRGERVVENGEPLWDPFFGRSGGAAFTRDLEMRYGMLVNRDGHRRTIALFGTIEKRRAARAAILAKVQYLRSQNFHTFPLEGRLIGFFMSADLMKLQQQLGHENVAINLEKRVLTVRGNEDALIMTQDVLRKVQRRHVSDKTKQGDECPVCFSETTLPITLPCGHSWCKSCLVNYFMAAVDTRVFPLKCLGDEARCSQAISLQIALQVLSSNDYNAVARAAFLTYIHSRPKEFHYCPTPDCLQIYRGAPPDTVLQCPSCLVRICGNCHVEYHEGSSCPNRDAEDQRLFEDWTKNHDVKRCPGCKAPIERVAGCNHMTCTRCKVHICWVCLAMFSASGKVYDHMHAMHGGIGL